MPPTWETKLLTYRRGFVTPPNQNWRAHLSTELVKQANALAPEGWELVTFAYDDEGASIFLKRPKIDVTPIGALQDALAALETARAAVEASGHEKRAAFAQSIQASRAVICDVAAVLLPDAKES
jgi:hypothetical protein